MTINPHGLDMLNAILDVTESVCAYSIERRRHCVRGGEARTVWDAVCAFANWSVIYAEV